MALIDDFDRANETPLASPWVGNRVGLTSNQLNLASSVAIGSVSAQWSNSYHSTDAFDPSTSAVRVGFTEGSNHNGYGGGL
jgi:hypothetical protein